MYTLARPSRTVRFRAACQGLPRNIRVKITDLNFFRRYSFGKNVDQDTRVRLGRLTTRLYICLYAICLIILILCTSIEQRTLTTKIHNPSLSVAQQLQAKYIGTTECPCTKASIPIEEFVRIEPRFHQVSQINYRFRISLCKREGCNSSRDELIFSEKTELS